MASDEEIAQQQTLLTTNRGTLAHYLRQRAALGEAFAPPNITHGIDEARGNIQRIKRILRSWNIAVEDHPDDSDELPQTSQPEESQAPLTGIDRVKLRKILVDHFNEDELRDLCFDLHIDYESLPSIGKAGKARELVALVERHGRFSELLDRTRLLRPNIP